LKCPLFAISGRCADIPESSAGAIGNIAFVFLTMEEGANQGSPGVGHFEQDWHFCVCFIKAR
jgi:hypothetical protein